MAIEYIGSGIDVLFIDAAIKAAGASFTSGKGELIGAGRVRLTDDSGNESFYEYKTKGSGIMEPFTPKQRTLNGYAIESVSVNLPPKSCTVGTAYSNYPSVVCTPTDDGSANYSYAWSLSDTTKGISITDYDKKAPTISGTPTAAGSITIYCDVTDVYGTTKEGTVTLTIAASA